MKIVITGMGALTSLGTSVDESFAGLLAGRTGVRLFPEWREQKGLFSHLGAPVPDYDISRLSRNSRRTMSRMSEMATLATIQALQQADLALGEVGRAEKTLFCMGSTTGSPKTFDEYFRKMIERGGPEGQFSTSFFKIMNHTVPANVAHALGFNGAVISPSSACATSAHAMILAWELLQTGLYDIVVAGGADELHFTSAAVFDIVLAASRGFGDRPDQAPRPFDQARDGLVVSEGAAMVVMETEKSAQARGVRPLAEFCGGAYLCDGTHMSQSSAETMVRVMKLALERAGRRETEMDYVNAHATGTIQGDREEARAIGELLGGQIPVSSLKGHFGHSLAACGALEAIASIKMMEAGILIPTRNLEQAEPECAHLNLFKENRPARVRNVLSGNFAFGGINTCLILSAVP